MLKVKTDIVNCMRCFVSNTNCYDRNIFLNNIHTHSTNKYVM